jgi:hypothetical protein
MDIQSEYVLAAKQEHYAICQRQRIETIHYHGTDIRLNGISQSPIGVAPVGIDPQSLAH